MNSILVDQLLLEIIDPPGQRSTNISNLKLAHARHSLSRELFVSSKTTLYELHLIIQKLFGWKDMFPHHFSLSDDDFILLTKGNPDTYSDLCGIIFRPWETQSFDWCWHGLKDNPELSLCAVMTEGSFFNMKRRMSALAGVDTSRSPYPRNILHLKPESNCFIERLTLSEIFRPRPRQSSFYSQDNVDRWRKKLLVNAKLCIEQLLALREASPGVFYEEYDAMEELDGWKDSLEHLLRIRENPTAIEARFGMDYEEALRHHLEMIISCFEMGKDIIENYNPSLEPFFYELLYKYDRGQDWRVRIRCLNTFELSCAEPASKVAGNNAVVNMVAEPMTSQLAYNAQPSNRSSNISRPIALVSGNETCTLAGSEAPIVSKDTAPIVPGSEAPIVSRDTAPIVSGSEAPIVSGKKAPIWIDSKLRPVSSKIRESLDGMGDAFSPVCSRADGVMLIDDIGGISGFFDFLRTLNGKNQSASKKVREQAEIYGWNEKTDPTKIKL